MKATAERKIAVPAERFGGGQVPARVQVEELRAALRINYRLAALRGDVSIKY